mmetsp:Transcript_37462/g.120057  ORF Transcript_37462/g.120057 Transcript_37462/m.120057 type:complete len:379 (-) Transcript_37462:200-1336(-)
MVFDLWTDDKAPNNGSHGDPFLASPKPRAQQDRPPAPPSLGRQGSSAGPMVKLLLGRTGADFLLLLEETDGAAHWQTRSWSEGGVPAALAAKLEKMRTKNHHVNEVSFGAAGEWFVHGVDAGGTSTFSWWDSAFAASRQLRKWTALPESRLHVAFGDEGRWLILQGHNGFCGAEHVAAGLQKRIRKLHDAKGTIGVVRLLPGGAYFIADSQGSQWAGLGGEVAAELARRGDKVCSAPGEPSIAAGEVLDVAVGADGSWVVLREHWFRASASVAAPLRERLGRFYLEQRARRAAAHAYERGAREATATALREATRVSQQMRKSGGGAVGGAAAGGAASGNEVSEWRALLERHILERRAEKERELQRGTILGWLRYYGIA